MRRLKLIKFTVLRFHTDHGDIFAVVETEKPDTILYGFTPDMDNCLAYLRRCRQRQYLLDGSPQEIPTPADKRPEFRRALDWYNNFLAGICHDIPDNREVLLLKTEKKTEIDHCTITDSYFLYASKPHKDVCKFVLGHYSTWYGNCPIKSTTDSDPESRLAVFRFLMEHEEAVRESVKNLSK